MSDKVHETFSDWTDTYGPIFRLQMLNAFAVVVTDPAACSKLLRKGSPDYAPKNTDLYGPLELGTFPQVHNILSSSDNAYWKAVRTGLAPCFSISNLKKVRGWRGRVRSEGGQTVSVQRGLSTR
jgi:cytochrome P450